LGEFTLSNFKTTVNGDNIVVDLHDRRAGDDRLATITDKANSPERVEKGTHGWLWICHTNLNPIP
jgi:hypothetical protein